MRKPHPVVWTASRVQAWQETGHRPPVAVWTAAQTATFWAVCAVIRCTARLQAQALAQLAAAGEPVDRLGVARRARRLADRNPGEPVAAQRRHAS